MRKQIELGTSVADNVTGLQGVLTARITHLHGRSQGLVEPRAKDGKAECTWIDDARLCPVEEYLARNPSDVPAAQQD